MSDTYQEYEAKRTAAIADRLKEVAQVKPVDESAFTEKAGCDNCSAVWFGESASANAQTHGHEKHHQVWHVKGVWA